MIFEKDIHEGVVSLLVECTDPDDREYCTGADIDKNVLQKYDLQPGDTVQYKITKNREVKIVGKIKTTKVITPI